MFLLDLRMISVWTVLLCTVCVVAVQVLVLLFLALLPLFLALSTISLLYLHRLLCPLLFLLPILILICKDLLRPIRNDAKDVVFGGTIELVDHVLGGGSEGAARATAAVEPVGRGSRVAKKEQVEETPSEGEEKHHGGIVNFGYDCIQVCVMDQLHDIDDRS